MGQRANLVVITAGGLELYYSHWHANTLDEDLFWGPEHATKFARLQRSEAEGAEWLDDVWAEGGAVIDHVRRTLLWFGGEDVLHEVLLRRLHLEWMQLQWSPWEVRWAAEGIIELAEFAGVDRSRVVAAPRPREECKPIGSERLEFPSEDPQWIDEVISVVDGGALKLRPIWGPIRDFVAEAPNFATALREAKGLETADLAKWTTQFPGAGLHVDFDARMVGLWSASHASDPVQHLQQAFPTFQAFFWRDRFEEQLARTAGALRFPLLDESALIDRLRAMLLSESKDQAESFRSAVEIISQSESPRAVTEINPFALRDDRLEMESADRERLLEGLIARWRSTRGPRA